MGSEVKLMADIEVELECPCDDLIQSQTLPQSSDDQTKFFSQNTLTPRIISIPPGSVRPAITANPYRTGVTFFNLGTTGPTLLLRVHQSNIDPTAAAATAALTTLRPSTGYTPDNKCALRTIQ